MQGYTAKELEDALTKLWTLVEFRLTEEDYKKLGINLDSDTISGIFEELHCCGPRGFAGIGLGRVGGHAPGE